MPTPPLAPDLNAFRLAFDPVLLQPLQVMYARQIGPFLEHPDQADKLKGVYYQQEVLPGGDFDLLSYDTYPLLWVTARTAASHQYFQDFFNTLPLADFAPRLKVRKQLRLYGGFFVVGNRASEWMWHYDYRPKARAYTLITPLQPWITGHGHLGCLPAGAEATEPDIYTYQHGEAIVFGDGFLHSTEPYAPHDQHRILVSLTFGSDRWQDWDLIRQNIAEQSNHYGLPCGHSNQQACTCYSRWQQRQQWKRRLGLKGL